MLIGREKEKKILESALLDDKSRFIAVYGRRRIGKTFLIRETFGYRFTFQHAGLANGNLAEQLFAFESSLKDAGITNYNKPANWLEAFELLKDLIRESKEKKKVIFIDELSWMDTRNCDLMTALENFWNGWASGRKDVVLIVCASATSWMLNKIVHNKGGLYHRLTDQINLKAFNLHECESFVQSMGIILNRHQILQCYMIMGGVPYYWSLLKKGMSLSQNIDAIFFEDGAPLADEFDHLYASLFKNPEGYLKIISALGTKKTGMTREEIVYSAKVSNSGELTKKLDELEACGFIRKYYAFDAKKKGALFQLMDCFTLFYYKFLKEKPTDEHFWSNQVNTPAVNAWSGLAFERVCMEHVAQIKQKLGIMGVFTEVKGWSCSANLDEGIYGSQIDLLIVRKDQVINLCEMKYASSEYTVTAKVNESIQHKVSDLATVTKTKYAIHPTLVTTYGLINNSYAGNIQAVITAEDLFSA